MSTLKDKFIILPFRQQCIDLLKTYLANGLDSPEQRARTLLLMAEQSLLHSFRISSTPNPRQSRTSSEDQTQADFAVHGRDTVHPLMLTIRADVVFANGDGGGLLVRSRDTTGTGSECATDDNDALCPAHATKGSFSPLKEYHLIFTLAFNPYPFLKDLTFSSRYGVPLLNLHVVECKALDSLEV